MAQVFEIQVLFLDKRDATRIATPGFLRKVASLGFRNAADSSNIGFSFVTTRITFSVSEATRHVRIFEVPITRIATPGVLRKVVFLGFRNEFSRLRIGFSFVTRIAFSVSEATRHVRIFEVPITRIATPGVLRKVVFLGFRNAADSSNIGFSFVTTRITFSASEATLRTSKVPITRIATPGVLRKVVSLGFRNAVSSLNIGFSFVTTRITFSVSKATRHVRTFEVQITRIATPGVLWKFVSLGFRNVVSSLSIGVSFVTRITLSVNEATRLSDRRPLSTLIGDLCRRLPLCLLPYLPHVVVVHVVVVVPHVVVVHVVVVVVVVVVHFLVFFLFLLFFLLVFLVFFFLLVFLPPVAPFRQGAKRLMYAIADAAHVFGVFLRVRVRVSACDACDICFFSWKYELVRNIYTWKYERFFLLRTLFFGRDYEKFGVSRWSSP